MKLSCWSQTTPSKSKAKHHSGSSDRPYWTVHHNRHSTSHCRLRCADSQMTRAGILISECSSTLTPRCPRLKTTKSIRQLRSRSRSQSTWSLASEKALKTSCSSRFLHKIKFRRWSKGNCLRPKFKGKLWGQIHQMMNLIGLLVKMKRRSSLLTVTGIVKSRVEVAAKTLTTWIASMNCC